MGLLRLLGDFCVQVIRAQHYGMIGRRRLVVVVLSPASVVDKPRDPALRVVTYGEHGASISLMSMECPCRYAGNRGLGQLVREEGLICVESCLGGCRIGELWLWTSSAPLFREVVCIGILPLSLRFRKKPSCPSWLPDKWKISIYLKAREITWPGRRSKVPDSGTWTRDTEAGTRTWGQGPGTKRQEPGPWKTEAGEVNNMTFFIGLYKLHRIIMMPCRSFLDALALDETLPPWWGYAGVGRKFDGEAGNIGIKGDVSDHTPGACAAFVAILGLSSGRAIWFHESCGGVYGSVPKNSESENLGDTKDQGDE
ncbi:hypothetical protein DY000_02040221 [Brassica cretica]|uniref:Uncharacterized protein n=1 Tax=Brassica cretica TaxID=69181 RepID=A0ABQ7B5M7_BRACR|nr:hypothetical protein DY000_02040221 [Brassica cretica]